MGLDEAVPTRRCLEAPETSAIVLAPYVRTRDNLRDLKVENALKVCPERGLECYGILPSVPHDLPYIRAANQCDESADSWTLEHHRTSFEYGMSINEKDVMPVGGPEWHEGQCAVLHPERVALAIEDQVLGLQELRYGQR
jgi:hypothetical protein